MVDDYPPRGITTDDALARVDFLVSVAEAQLGEMMVRLVHDEGARLWQIVTVFDGADARGLRALRALDTQVTHLPENAAAVMLVPYVRLMRIAKGLGYKTPSKRSRKSTPGKMPVVFFTLGVMVINHVDLVPLSPQGSA